MFLYLLLTDSTHLSVQDRSSPHNADLHLRKVLLPAQLLQLSTLLLHVLGASLLGVSLNLALDGGVESTDDTGSEESGVDAVVDADGCDGDT